jgi:citrate synthase
MTVEGKYSKGLEGVVAGESTICQIDVGNSRLYYRGYAIEDLVRESSFEETTFLLVNEHLPTADELSDFTRRMRSERGVNSVVRRMISEFPSAGKPMEMLQSVISYLSGTREHQVRHSGLCNCRTTLHQVAQLATVLATYDRLRRGKPYLEPRADLGHAANFLYMLTGKEPSARDARVFDGCLIMHAEHGFNASTFTARVVASTLSTCYSSISAAIGALNGSLHGGANEGVMDMLDEIGSPDKVAGWLDRTLAAKGKVMGMGHRIYRGTDPRAVIMERFLEDLCRDKGDTVVRPLLHEIERQFRARMDAEGKALYPNLDFYSGAVYTLLGIPRDLFTPIFAMARAAGWLAHILEQRKDNRLYRPDCLFVGSAPRPYVPVEARTT